MILAPRTAGISKAGSIMNGFCGKIGVLFCMLACAGCTVSNAAHKNLALLEPGTPRLAIRGEFGEPLLTLTADDITTDVYGFYQGYAGPSRYLGLGLPDVKIHVPYEPCIEEHPEPFREDEPDDFHERLNWAQRKSAHENYERQRCDAYNEAHAEEIAAQKLRRAEAQRDAVHQRLQEIHMLAQDQVPGFPGLALSNPFDRPGSAGIVVFAVTYDEAERAKLFDIAQGQKLVDAARKKSRGFFARKPAALPSSGFFKIALEQPRAAVRSTTISTIPESY